MKEAPHELVARLVFLVEQRTCRNVQIVTRQFDYPDIEPLMAGYKEGQDMPWVWYDTDSDHLMARAITWDGWGPRVKVGAGVMEDVAGLAFSFGQACLTGNAEQFEQKLVEFYETFGPLGIAPGRQEGPPLDLILFKAYLAFFGLLARAYMSTISLREGQPPRVGIGEDVIRHYEQLFELQELERFDGTLPEELRSSSWEKGAPIHDILLNVFRGNTMPQPREGDRVDTPAHRHAGNLPVHGR